MKFFELFHFHSKKRKRSVANPHDKSRWPREWKTTFYKSYPRFIDTPLSPAQRVTYPLSDAILERHSSREYQNTCTEAALSTLLALSSGILPAEADGRVRRVYASGGGRYPIETYVLIAKPIGAFLPGLYHYNVRKHALTNLQAPALTKDNLADMLLYPESCDASCVLIYTAVFKRQTGKYGNRGYRHALMEAGGISEHVGIVAAALGVAQCPMSGYFDEVLEKYLDIDGVTESVVHTIVVG
jgi:SagB-type dehydrogenase family enzyme